MVPLTLASIDPERIVNADLAGDKHIGSPPLNPRVAPNLHEICRQER
jgi:hypothetical protein